MVQLIYYFKCYNTILICRFTDSSYFINELFPPGILEFLARKEFPNVSCILLLPSCAGYSQFKTVQGCLLTEALYI